MTLGRSLDYQYRHSSVSLKARLCECIPCIAQGNLYSSNAPLPSRCSPLYRYTHPSLFQLNMKNRWLPIAAITAAHPILTPPHSALPYHSSVRYDVLACRQCCPDELQCCTRPSPGTPQQIGPPEAFRADHRRSEKHSKLVRQSLFSSTSFHVTYTSLRLREMLATTRQQVEKMTVVPLECLQNPGTNTS